MQDPPSPTGARRGCVLVVDDEPDIRGIVAEELELEGFHVLSAGSGDEALRVLAQAGSPDEVALGLLVTDLRMPGMSGFDLVAALRARHGPVPAIIATGLLDDGARAKAAALGGCDFVEKPYDLDHLVTLVGRYVLRA